MVVETSKEQQTTPVLGDVVKVDDEVDIEKQVTFTELMEPATPKQSLEVITSEEQHLEPVVERPVLIDMAGDDKTNASIETVTSWDSPTESTDSEKSCDTTEVRSSICDLKFASRTNCCVVA